MKIITLVGNAGSGKDTAASYLVEKGYVIAALADKIKQLAAPIFDFSERSLFGPSEFRNAIDNRGADSDYWRNCYFNAGQVADELLWLFEEQPTTRCEPVLSAFRNLLDVLERDPEKFSPRRVLQFMGTEFGRNLWEDVWIEALKNTISEIENGASYSRLYGTASDWGTPPPGVVITDCRFPNEAKSFKDFGGEIYWIDSSVRAPRDMTLEHNKHASEPSQSDFDGLLTGVIDNNGTLEDLKAKVLLLA